MSWAWPSALTTCSVFTGPVPGAVHTLSLAIEWRLPTFVTMYMFTSVARKVPAGTETDWVPPPWTVTSAVSDVTGAELDVEHRLIGPPGGHALGVRPDHAVAGHHGNAAWSRARETRSGIVVEEEVVLQRVVRGPWVKR